MIMWIGMVVSAGAGAMAERGTVEPQLDGDLRGSVVAGIWEFCTTVAMTQTGRMQK